MHFLSIVKRIRVEPFIFLFFFASALEGITITQLAQDKICVLNYGLEPEYCSKLSQQISSDTEFDFKSQILSDVTQFTLYRTLISTIPVIFWSLFLGSWADRHSSAPKVLMSLASIASVLETILLLLNAIYFEIDVNFMLLSFVPISLFGGLMSVTMSFYSYISSTTQVKLKTIRFAIIESLIFVALPLGIFIGGKLISVTFNGRHGQLHDYMSVFVLGLIAQISASIWIIFIPLEKPLKEKEDSIDRNHNEVNNENNLQIEITKNLIESSNETTPLIEKSYSEPSFNLTFNEEVVTKVNLRINIVIRDKKRWFHIFNDLIDLRNIREMISTCTKPRSGNKRAEIWILFISLSLVSLTNNGSHVVLFQFVQKAFLWDAEIYSIVNSSVLVITAISVAVVVPILIKVLKVNDISLSIIGVLGLYIQNLIRGTLLNVNAFYVSFIFGSLAYVPSISVRSKLSNIVDKNEENKVFGLLAALETSTPFISSIIYSTVFELTLISLPGLVFQMSCVFLFIPLLGFIYISLYCA